MFGANKLSPFEILYSRPFKLPIEAVSLVKPGDRALIKVIKRKCCSSPRWEGPFQVLLTAPITVELSEKHLWIHLLHCKKQVPLTSSSK
ncbi:hypothetical protein D4764_04G0010310 [Takifugu flavidus]|uniref:Murine leukemia virus integrase C-terminal domain-containing protein n=1 Tax=Takifugu flavidus TaxID=433684 RepID=A0A5C6N4J5_9TELE|nr:hypothetical protein D4764_04G0010310 [Takifugu flavidus]